MSAYLEYTAVAFGIIYVLLAARGNVWCWLMGIINSALYIYINLQAQLYYDSLLQLFYVVAGFYGWWKWLESKEETFVIERLSLRRQLPLIFLGAIATIILGVITFLNLHSYIAFYDAAIFSFSLIATWMTAKKFLESWIWWIIIDIGAIRLYMVKDLEATSVQFLVFTLAAFYGYFEWKRNISRKNAKAQS